MSSAERVERVLAATVTSHFGEDLVTTTPLIAAGDELYFSSTDQVRAFVRRILAAADGVTEFIDRPRPARPTPPARRGARRNPAGAAAYALQKQQRRH